MTKRPGTGQAVTHTEPWDTQYVGKLMTRMSQGMSVSDLSLCWWGTVQGQEWPHGQHLHSGLDVTWILTYTIRIWPRWLRSKHSSTLYLYTLTSGMDSFTGDWSDCGHLWKGTRKEPSSVSSGPLPCHMSNQNYGPSTQWLGPELMFIVHLQYKGHYS